MFLYMSFKDTISDNKLNVFVILYIIVTVILAILTNQNIIKDLDGNEYDRPRRDGITSGYSIAAAFAFIFIVMINTGEGKWDYPDRSLKEKSLFALSPILSVLALSLAAAAANNKI